MPKLNETYNYKYSIIYLIKILPVIYSHIYNTMTRNLQQQFRQTVIFKIFSKLPLPEYRMYAKPNYTLTNQSMHKGASKLHVISYTALVTFYAVLF